MRRYDLVNKNEAVKLAAEIGRCKAAQELGMPQGTLDINLSVILNGHCVASVLSEEPLLAI